MDFYTPHIIGSLHSEGRRKSYKRRLSFRLVIAVLVVVLVILSVAAGLAIYQPYIFKLKRSEYHMLILSKETTLAAAEAMQKQVVLAGGSGYIINDGEFLVTAFVYEKKSDANSVCERMKENYTQADVISYIHGKTKIKRFGSRSTEKILKNLLDYPIKLLNSVIGCVYSLDSFESRESEIMLKAEKLKATLKANMEAARGFFDINSKISPPAAALFAVNFYNDIYESFCNVTLLSNSENKLTHRLKNFSCEVALKYHNLRYELKKL